jgi:hypothetical protein
MHPSKMTFRALSVAAKAEDDGFTSTADALRLLAEVCADEAIEDEQATLSLGDAGQRDARQGGATRVEIVH